MKRLLLRLVSGVLVLAAAATLVLALPQAASAVDFFGGLCEGEGSDSAACSGSGDDELSGSDGIILRVAELVSIIAGIAAIIIIMISGIMFITAAGDSSKITTAKRTIIYAVVGLAVIALARAIVIFVVGNI